MRKRDAQATANPCIKCLNYAGGCNWTRVDPKTNRIAFQPVEGWEATQLDGDRVAIHSCPEFKLDPKENEIHKCGRRIKGVLKVSRTGKILGRYGSQVEAVDASGGAVSRSTLHLLVSGVAANVWRGLDYTWIFEEDYEGFMEKLRREERC